jgi:hypothetical protein
VVQGSGHWQQEYAGACKKSGHIKMKKGAHHIACALNRENCYLSGVSGCNVCCVLL